MIYTIEIESTDSMIYVCDKMLHEDSWLDNLLIVINILNTAHNMR